MSKSKGDSEIHVETFFIELTFLYKKGLHKNFTIPIGFRVIFQKLISPQVKLTYPVLPHVYRFLLHIENSASVNNPMWLRSNIRAEPKMVDIQKTIASIFHSITGKSVKKSKIIRINNDLTINGDLSFPSNLLAWRGLITPEDDDNKPMKNILEYYLITNKIDTSTFTDEDITKKAIDSLITASENWDFTLNEGCLQRERVYLSLNRPIAISKIIKSVIKHNIQLLQKNNSRETDTLQLSKNIIFLTINDDPESNLTTLRLRKLKNMTEKILKLQGYKITEISPEKYLLTTKSQGLVEDGCRKYICGVVKNPGTNVKETSETYDGYLQRRIKELEELNEGREMGEKGEKLRLKRIAEAIMTFEMLGVRPSRPSFIEIPTKSDKSIATTKGGSFVLYNVARIEAIFRKFEAEYERNYPGVEDVNEIDFSRLSSQEEWSLVYNFILAYPQVLMDSVQHGENLQLCPQILCSFLSQLSQKFSVYYRRTRILTEEREHLIPTMMARLCLLKALLIVIYHALEILDITPILQM